MDKRAKDKLIRSPWENWGGQEAQKIFTQELEGTRRRGRPRKGWKEEVERDLQVLEVRRWREMVIDREKWKGIFSTGQSPQWAVVPMEEEESFFKWNKSWNKISSILCSRYEWTRYSIIKPFKTKHRLLYLKTQFVPCSKHFSSQL